MKAKTILILLLISLTVTSCTRFFTPDQAASRSMKCGKGSLK